MEMSNEMEGPNFNPEEHSFEEHQTIQDPAPQENNNDEVFKNFSEDLIPKMEDESPEKRFNYVEVAKQHLKEF